ncbi:MAG TPA: metal-sensing transcriptional repressor [Burkholderiaceae bacterium]|nr:metal-sensing transcriptional repressor [Burkholderiaceae bacterium]
MRALTSARACPRAATMPRDRPAMAALENSTMAHLSDESARTDLLNRLKRAEGQLRGVQRMIETGESCLDIAGQMAAVRKALDAAYVRMTVCFMQQELQSRLAPDTKRGQALAEVLDEVQTLLGKMR